VARLWLSLAAAGLVVSGGCSFGNAYACEADDQCALRSGGACEVAGWCGYPSDDCDSGRVYGPHAPPAVANTCVPTEGGSSSGGSSSTSEGGDLPVAVCGNGVVEPGEFCDDGNTLPADACHPLCVEPYEAVWTAAYDQSGFDDRGFALAVDDAAGAIYVAGFTTAAEVTGDDLLVQRYDLERGGLEWTWSRDAGTATDRAEDLLVDGDGNVIVGGVETIEGTTERAWLASFDAAGVLSWERHDALGSKLEGVALADDGRIFGVGRTGSQGSSQTWHQWYGADGTPQGEPVLGDDSTHDNRGVDAITVPGVGVQLAGIRFSEDAPRLWTARYDATGALLWEHALADPDGDVPRWVGQDMSPLGGTAVGGVRNNDRVVQFYDDDGVPRGEPWVDSSPGHDEVADLVFLDDGRYVVVGFVGFNLNDSGTADGWIRFNEPDGTEIRTYAISGTGGGVDKMLAVEKTPHGVVVTGYVDNESTDRDLWLRLYAI